MKSIKLSYLLVFSIFTVSALFLSSCKSIIESPDGCVVAFIVTAEQRNMTKAWDLLGPDAQSYYNSQGEKLRKSGKGALENEIAKITKFRRVKKDYFIEKDKSNPDVVNIVTIGGNTHPVETINIDGNYKIKNEASVKNALDGISAEVKKQDGY
jgi:hypothetical protein